MKKNLHQQPGLASVIGMTSLVALVGIGLAVAAYVRRYVLHDIPMTAALSGDLRDCFTPSGRLAYYVGGPHKRSAPLAIQPPANPLLLIHGINAAPSSYEMKPLYDYYVRDRKVYSLEMPGFGFSERTERSYTPLLYRDAILTFIRTELKGAPVDAVALSLSCEFLALAAVERPEYFRTLTFISPTGLAARVGHTRASDMILRLLLMPSWNRLFFDLLTSRPAIRFFIGLGQMNGYDRGLAHYAYVASHQPDAQYAGFYFAAGKLFTPEIISTYLSITQPVLMVYGQSKTTRYDRLATLRARPNWKVVEFGHARDLIQYDDNRGLIAEMDKFLAQR